MTLAYKTGDLVHIPAHVHLYGSIENRKQPVLFSIPLKVTKKPELGIFLKIVSNGIRENNMAEIALGDNIWRIEVKDLSWVKNVS